MENKYTSAIILAAGLSTRMNNISKQLVDINGDKIIEYTLNAFQNCDLVNEIILVIKEDEKCFYTDDLLSKYNKISKVVLGGNTRFESASNGIKAISSSSEFVAIHDGARCLITPSAIEKVIKEAYLCGAAIAATKATDTIKQVDENGYIVKTIDRNIIWNAQTPQVFKTDLIENKYDSNSNPTDDSMLFEQSGIKVKCVDVEINNLKITYPHDLKIVESVLGDRK